MTIEIEAGASHTQCSMEAASAGAVSKGIWDRVDGEFFAVSPGHPGCTSSFPEKEKGTEIHDSSFGSGIVFAGGHSVLR
jgi:hypothetical protein